MSGKKGSSNKYEDMEVRRGPWTLEEDTLLVHYIASHGEGRWNLLARCSGLKRTGKSCRLRWLNYLKPDIKRGNLSPEEHLLIHELHSRWGNRWSRIAQYLPGRTDNEIKNYWRTRMQKQARQLKIDPSSTTFRDAIRYHCRMPRLPEKMSSPHSMQTLHANAAPQDPLQGLLQPSTHCQFENPSPYELSGAGIGSNSTGLSSTVLLPQVPDLKVSSSSPTAEINGVEFNPFHSGSSVDTTYGVGACDDLAAMTASANCYPASSSSTTTASNHFMNSINGDSMWGMDELYGMLKSYIDGAESTCFLGTKLKVDAQLN